MVTRILPNVCRVISRLGNGSGIVFGADLILTCRHVVGKETKGEWKKIDKSHELCCLHQNFLPLFFFVLFFSKYTLFKLDPFLPQII